MKRFLITFTLLLTMLTPSLLISGQAAAVNIFGSCGSGSAAGPPGVCVDAQTGQTTTVNPVVSLIATIIKILAFVIGVAAIIGVVLSGIRMMTANGDSNSVATARSALLYSLVGVAVAVLAQVIVDFVIGWLSK